MVCGGIRETANQFVDVPDALNGSERAPIPDEQTISDAATMEEYDAYPAL